MFLIPAKNPAPNPMVPREPSFVVNLSMKFIAPLPKSTIPLIKSDDKILFANF